MQSATRRRVSLSGCLAIGLTLLMLVIGLVSLLRPSGSGGTSFDTSPYALDLAKRPINGVKTTGRPTTILEMGPLYLNIPTARLPVSIHRLCMRGGMAHQTI